MGADTHSGCPRPRISYLVGTSLGIAGEIIGESAWLNIEKSWDQVQFIKSLRREYELPT